ncbi:MAG: hypothetical protein C4K60_06300 [Ideonella sp. MAG2]|nr:MAG: hypothetical protein C4K60_06300 [Ideonella sp. MAG2]
MTALASALACAGSLQAAPLVGVVSPAPKTLASTELPTDGKVVAGQAGIVQSGSTLNINQSSQRAVIDWNTFNVGSQAEVRFQQPDTQSATLNRVLDSNASQIAGKISANGQVYLSNPNGVLFAPGSSVDVGALVATTHSLSTADFMAGKESFQRQGASGQVINEGTLQARLGGYIAMLAPEVRNQGVVVVPMGTVVLAAGEVFHLQFNASGKLTNVRVEPSTLKALVENRHAIVAPGGLVILSARAANALQGGVVRNSGTIEAKGVNTRGGRILLEGDTVINTGTLDVSSAQHQGGTVEIKATTLELGGVVNASGVAGGQVLVHAAQSAVVQAEIQAMGLEPVSAATEAHAAKLASSSVGLAGLKLDMDDQSLQGHGGQISLSADHSLTLMNAQLEASGVRQGGSIKLAAEALPLDLPDAPLPPPSRPTAPTSVTLSGSSSLRSNSRSGRAGRVVLTGDDLHLNDQTQLSASGATGGGTILVGGDWQGSNGVYQATKVQMGAEASMDASATEQGGGGTVVLWSDIHKAEGITVAQGRITATGGAKGGNGGKVETSGHQVDTTGIVVDAGAPKGKGGLWLIDPYDYTIGSTQASSIASVLNTGTDVTVTTSLNNPSYGSSGSAGDQGNITVNAAITKTAGGDATLTLQAASRVYVNAGANISSSANRLNVVLWSNNSGANLYGISLLGSVTTNGGGFWAGGGAGTSTWVPYSGASALTVGNGAAYGSSSGNYNAIDLWAPINTANGATGGNVSILAATTSVGGTATSINGTGGSISAGSGNVVMRGSTFSWSGAMNVGTTGTFSFLPSGVSFGQTIASDYFNFTSTLSGLNLGGSGNTADVTFNTTPSVAGNVNVFGGNVTLGSNITTTGASSAVVVTALGNINPNANITAPGGISLRAAGSITNNSASSSTFTTSNTPILFAADTDGAGGGQISLNQYSGGTTFNSAGGDVTLGGGDVNGSGYATGLSSSQAEGIRFTGGSAATNAVTINSGGGNVALRGKSWAGTSSVNLGAWGVGTWSGTSTINSGTGTILVNGIGQTVNGYNQGIYIDGGATFTSSNTTANAISVVGSAAAASGSTNANGPVGLNIEGSNNYFMATGVGGGVTLSGTRGSNSSYDLVLRGSARVLANGGPINLTAGSTGGILYLSLPGGPPAPASRRPCPPIGSTWPDQASAA